MKKRHLHRGALGAAVVACALGVMVASSASGAANWSNVTSATQGLGEPTGWHFHVCEHQLVYMLKGWVDLEFEDGTKVRLMPGDSLMIPDGMNGTEILEPRTDSFRLLVRCPVAARREKSRGTLLGKTGILCCT